MSTATPALPPRRTDPVIAVHDTHATARRTVAALGEAGFDLSRISIVGKGYQSEMPSQAFYSVGERIRSWGRTGTVWGAFGGLLLGVSTVAVPPLGPLVAAGPIVLALVGALEGAVLVGGLSSIVAALTSLGVDSGEAIRYENELRADRFLVIVHGSDEEIQRARAIARRCAAPAVEAVTA